MQLFSIQSVEKAVQIRHARTSIATHTTQCCTTRVAMVSLMLRKMQSPNDLSLANVRHMMPLKVNFYARTHACSVTEADRQLLFQKSIDFYFLGSCSRTLSSLAIAGMDGTDQRRIVRNVQAQS
jgi:hypothetical protein